jgi:hypothetical protein
MDLHINIDNNNVEIDACLFQKMAFVHNALQDGWTVKKKNDFYVFTKKHEGKKEILLDSYLSSFMKSNVDVNKLLSSS